MIRQCDSVADMHMPSNEFAFGRLQPPHLVGLLGMFDSSQEIGWRLKITIAASGASDAYFNSCREQLVAWARKHELPAIYEFREFAASGGGLGRPWLTRNLTSCAGPRR